MRTSLAVTTATNHGDILALTSADLVNGSQFINDGSTVLGIYNADPVNTMTITIQVPKLVDGNLTVQNRVYYAPPLMTYLIGKLPKDVYNQADNNVYIDFSIPALVAVVSM